jgi:hypothetical protein
MEHRITAANYPAAINRLCSKTALWLCAHNLIARSKHPSSPESYALPEGVKAQQLRSPRHVWQVIAKNATLNAWVGNPTKSV